MSSLFGNTRVLLCKARVFCIFNLLICCTAFMAQSAFAQQAGGFTGGVTPSRFEIKAKPGDVVKQSLSIYNLGSRPETFTARTNDWTYSSAGGISFSSRLLSNSCRQWVKLERHEFKVLPDPRRARSFRFEVHIPEDAETRECRFAIMIGSKGKPFVNDIGGRISLPATGKVGVIVYLAIGDVKPDSQIESYTVKDENGRLLPAIVVKNSGQAHDRLDSELQGEDQNGRKFRLSVATSPIMPGQTRAMLLNPSNQDLDSAIAYPLSIKGRIFTKTRTIVINESQVGGQ